MAKYLLNAFSLNMLPLVEATYRLHIKPVDVSEFCSEIKGNEVKNAVGHQATIDVINELCATKFTVNRVEVHLDPAITNTLYIVQISTRLPEGTILQREELQRLLAEGKIRFLEVEISREG